MKEIRIVIVDDLPEHIRILTEILLSENPDYKIYAAINGKNAIELALIKEPHIIIMDWDMPVMNGIEATRAIKTEPKIKNIPIIISSGMHTDSSSMKEALSLGAIDFIRKPIDKIELIARVNSMLRFVESYEELISQKELNHNLELQYKAQELNTLALNIANKNEFLLQMVDKLKLLLENSNAQAKKQIYNLIETTNNQLKENAWENFEQQFYNVYPAFMQNLSSKYTSLTPTERKLCLLLRMDLSSKEIAHITFQEPNSIDVARYRLRQKLGLDKEVNLVHFLMSI